MNIALNSPRELCAIALSALLFHLPLTATAQSSSYWRHVTVGGGGCVTGIFADPHTNGRYYMRTDIGGVNRWDAATSRWTPITEKLPYSNDFGIETLAVHPTVANTLYIGTGKYPWDTARVYKSSDAGATWVAKAAPTGLSCNSNGGNRVVGERLQVDPNNSNVLYYATRNVGLWKSTNGATSWTKITSVPAGSANLGQSFVTFDKNGGITGGASAIIYVGVYGTGDGGVWKSVDGGTTWIKMSGGSATPARGAVAGDGTFYTTALGTSTGGVFRAARNGATLSSITPSAGIGYCALAVDPQNSQIVLVSKMLDQYNCPTWRSTNGGLNWTVVGSTKGTTNLATRDNTSWFGLISSLAINPFNTKEVWLADWVGVLRTSDITTSSAPWNYAHKGHEEIVPLILRSAPSGATLLSGSADVNGGRHTDLTQSPPKAFMQTSSPLSYGSTTSLDFCEANPNVWARVLNSFVGGKTGYYSLDNGLTWTAFASIPSGATGGRIAVSATNSNYMVWAPENGKVYYTSNRGASWTQATSAPSIPSTQFGQNSQALTSDRVDGNNYYLFRNVYNAGKGEVWRSLDSGATWTLASTITYGNSGYNAYQFKIAAMPGNAGTLWLNLGYSATYRSTNAAASFSVVSGVSSVGKIAFGKPAPGRTNPTIFVDGSAGGLSGILRSDDNAATWTQVSNSSVPINNSRMIIEADRQTYGRVYVGTDGSGIYVGDSTSEFIVDNAMEGSVVATGSWPSSTSRVGYYGSNYQHDDATSKGAKSFRFVANLPVTGTYEVYGLWAAYSNRATNVPFDIIHSGGTSTVIVNQQQNGSVWKSLGTYTFPAGTGGSVLIRTTNTSGYVIADAVKFRKL